MPTKKEKSSKNGHEKLPTQKDIAASLKGKKITKIEQELIEISQQAVRAIQKEKERGIVW
jgi:hypothetical protein